MLEKEEGMKWGSIGFRFCTKKQYLMTQFAVFVAFFFFERMYSYTVSDSYTSSWKTLFQQIIPSISNALNLFFDDNENIKALFFV